MRTSRTVSRCSFCRTLSTIHQMKSPKDSLTINFGKRLVEIRMQKGMTQERLAEAANISADFISLMERGIRAPSFVTLERLSKALGVSVKEFFEFTSEPNAE